MRTLRILHVEDSERDAAAVTHHLSREGYKLIVERVETSETMKAALQAKEWDVILCDYTLPEFDALAALSLLRETGLDIPFIIISGNTGEETAVEAMLAGAQDYLIKDNLTRLTLAIEREFENAASRQAQKRAEEALRRSEENLANAQRIAHIGSWEWDIQNDQLFWSEEIYRIFGLTKSRFGGTYEDFLKGVHPDDREIVQSAVDNALSQSVPYIIEHRIIRPNGEERFVSEKGEVTLDDSGKPIWLVGTVQDITERKRTEEALENAAKRERAMIENSLDVICTIDAEGKFVNVSPASLKVWGYSPEELIGQPYIEFVAQEDAAKTNEAALEVMSGIEARNFENRYRHKNGSLVNVMWTAFWSEKDSLLFCVAHDITERKAAETEMRLMKSAFDSIVEGIVICDAQKPDNPIIYTNSAFENLTGYAFEEIRGQNCRFLQGAETNWRTVDEIREALEKETSFHGEILNYRKNGESFWNELSISPIFDEAGRLTNFVGVQQDISERKQTETILRASEAKIRQLVDSSIIGIISTRLNGSIIEANDVFLKTVGYSRSELLAEKLKWDKMTPPEILWQDTNAKKQLTEFGYSTPREKEYIRKDGSRVPVLVGGTLLKGTEDTVLAFVLDISEQKRVEEEKKLLTTQIERQHERLNNIVDNITGVVWEAWGKPDEAAQKIDFISDYVEVMLGYTVEEWLATPNFWLSIVHPDDRERMARLAAENFLKSRSYIEEFRWVAKDGRIVWVETHSTVICNKKGQAIGYRGVNIDITERKRLEEERTELITELDFEKVRLQHIFDNSPSFIVSMRGPDFVFEMANPAYYQLVGQRDLIGLPASEALPEIMTQGLSDIIRQVYNTGEPFIGNEAPVKLQPQDGSEMEQHYLNFVYMPLREADDSISGIISYGVDVTEQVLSRTKIQESEQRYRLLFENNPLPMWVFDLETLAFLSVNDASIAHYGYTREEFLSMTVKDIRPPEDVPFFLENIAHNLPGIKRAGFHRHIKKDGTVIDVEITTNQLIFNGKKAKLVLANDITERKLADRKIGESEERYRIVAETANDVIITIDEHSSILFVNSAVEKTLGYKPEELIGENLSIIVPERHRAAHNLGMNRYLQIGRKSIPWSGVEIQALHRDGSEKQVEISFGEYHENNKRLFTAVIRDVTERKQAQQIILESEEKYRSIVETANEGIWLTDLEPRTTYVNRQMAEMLGYTVEEMLGRPVFDFIFEEDMPAAKRKYEHRKVGESETGEFRLRRKDGSGIITLYNTTPRRNQAGEIVGFLSMRSDITESKKAEKKLIDAEAKYRTLVETSPAIIYLVEPHPPFATIYVSPNVTRYGYTAEEWFDRPDMWVSLIHDEDRARVLRATENAVAQGEETDMEYRVVAKDGAIVWMHDKGSFVLDEQGNKTGWQGMMVDITKNKELEDQLRQSQKLKSVGLLAGGIAHDFNNMLTAINGYSDLTMRKMDENDPLRRNIEEIKKAGERSADLTRQLLAFSRQQILQPIVLDLNEIIRDTIKMLERLIGEDIRLTTTLNPNIGLVKVDPGQLSQIIMNLGINARDAMPQGGKLTIETANVFLDPGYARNHVGVLPGAYVVLAVSDTGIGMSRQTKEHIFEPFFTTKEIGKGTGLGLATVYGIVKQSGGSIEVYSEESVGTTFKLYLPRIANPAVEPEIEDISFDLPKGTETILLVEDEEMVRNLTRTILEECGYTVFEAQNGVEALKMCEQGDCKFDLLMTDVVMPEMGGRELANLLKEKLPNLQVLFTSGYTDDAVVRHGVIEMGTNFIQKPFTPDLLAKKIQELLDSPK